MIPTQKLLSRKPLCPAEMDKSPFFELHNVIVMNRISWKQMKTNEKVLSSCKCQRSLLKTIRTRQLKFFSHIVRKQGLENLALTGKIAGKRNRGRKRMSFMSQFQGEPNDIIHNAYDRHRWKVYSRVAANAWNRLGN